MSKICAWCHEDFSNKDKHRRNAKFCTMECYKRYMLSRNSDDKMTGIWKSMIFSMITAMLAVMMLVSLTIALIRISSSQQATQNYFLVKE